MKIKWKSVLIGLAVIAAFFFQLYRGLAPSPPEPGFVPSGAAPAPMGVAVSAALTALLVWAALEGLFWLFSKLRKK